MQISYPERNEYTAPRGGNSSDSNLAPIAIAVIVTFILTAGAFMIYISQIQRDLDAQEQAVAANSERKKISDAENQGSTEKNLSGDTVKNKNASGFGSTNFIDPLTDIIEQPNKEETGIGIGELIGNISNNSQTSNTTTNDGAPNGDVLLDDPGTIPGEESTSTTTSTNSGTGGSSDSGSGGTGDTTGDTGTGDDTGSGGDSGPLCIIDPTNIVMLQHTNDCN